MLNGAQPCCIDDASWPHNRFHLSIFDYMNSLHIILKWVYYEEDSPLEKSTLFLKDYWLMFYFAARNKY